LGGNDIRFVFCGIINGADGKAGLDSTGTKERLDCLIAYIAPKVMERTTIVAQWRREVGLVPPNLVGPLLEIQD